MNYRNVPLSNGWRLIDNNLYKVIKNIGPTILMIMMTN